MAHRRAAARPRAWARWLMVPIALTLDAATAVHLAGSPFPMGIVVPEGVLFTVPLLVYGALAAFAFPTRSLGTRLAAGAVLLGIHAGLVLVHTACYIVLWSLPAPAAIRLAHRWSPLVPLLQVVWVPLLASPLVTLSRWRSAPASGRSVSTPGRRDGLASRAPRTGSRARVQPGRDAQVDLGGPGQAPEVRPMAPPTVSVVAPTVAVVDAPPAAEPEWGPITPAAPVPPTRVLPESPTVSVTASLTVPPTPLETVAEVNAAPLPAPVADSQTRTLAPTPIWFDDLVEASPQAVASASPAAESVDQDTPSDDDTAAPPAPLTPPTPLAVEAIALALVLPATPVAVERIAALPASTGDTREDERTRLHAAEPPVDPYVVARLFEPYGPLLSRDRTILVDWTPSPDASVLCAAPRGAFRDQVVSLGARFARVLNTVAAPAAPGPVWRLSIRGRDGVVVLTPLVGAVLVAAAQRRGALALLEVLSARVVPGAIRGEADTVSEDTAPLAVDIAVSGATRVETPAAIFDVLAPPGIEAATIGELAGRLLAAIPVPGEGLVLDSLSVDLGSHRLMIHPVHPDARPPRFVAVVGAPDRPGLLGRRTEQAARTLREAS